MPVSLLLPIQFVSVREPNELLPFPVPGKYTNEPSTIGVTEV